MKIIIITQPHFFDNEANVINSLFAAGLQILHLRKPQATLEQMTQILAAIAPDYRHRVVVHSHFELIPQFGLRGAHLSVNRQLPRQSANEDRYGARTFSCHTLAEVAEQKPHCEYVFLSPIFDSISKEGYSSAFSLDELKTASDARILDHKVVALGGITPSKLPMLTSLGFGGVALLGDIWQSPDPVARLQEYFKISQCNL